MRVLGEHSEHSARWRPGGPSEAPRVYFGGLWGDVGAPGRFLEALGEHFGALGAASGPLGSAPGIIFGAFWAVVGSDVGVYVSRAVVARIELYFARSPNLFFTFFQTLFKWQTSLPTRKY